MRPVRKIVPLQGILVWLVTTLVVAGLQPALAQQGQQEETTRQLWDTAFINQDNKPVAHKKTARRSYRIVTPHVPATGVSADTVIGVTLWRLRPARGVDTGERLITHENAEAVEWLPERVSSTGKLSEGDRIRMSIEAARTGYLYVVDQEVYADGSKGEPYLIFPTTRTLGGDNSVTKGRVVEIPGQDDNPPYFTLKRSRVDHVGESVIVLVTRTPIAGLTIGNKAQRLSNDTLASWEASWGKQVGRLELDGGEGKSWTKQERDAGQDGTRSMNQLAPAPQTLYYQPGAHRADPVLITVQLQYARTRQSTRKPNVH